MITYTKFEREVPYDEATDHQKLGKYIYTQDRLDLLDSLHYQVMFEVSNIEYTKLPHIYITPALLQAFKEYRFQGAYTWPRPVTDKEVPGFILHLPEPQRSLMVIPGFTGVTGPDSELASVFAVTDGISTSVCVPGLTYPGYQHEMLTIVRQFRSYIIQHKEVQVDITDVKLDLAGPQQPTANPGTGNGSKKSPHNRREHTRTLRSSYWGPKQGTTIRIPGCGVNQYSITAQTLTDASGDVRARIVECSAIGVEVDVKPGRTLKDLSQL
jgi:hypothetical protein